MSGIHRPDPETPGDPPDATPTAADLVRAEADGTLDAAGATRLRELLAADPALQAFRDDWRAVAAATAALDIVPPRTTRDASPQAAPTEPGAPASTSIPASQAGRTSPAGPVRRLPLPRLVAAAALVVGGLFAWHGVRVVSTPPTLVAPVLAQIAADGPAETAFTRDSAPEGTAGFVADDGRSVRWLTDWDQALALARWSGRPVLVFVQHPECPWCRQLDREVWTDAGVRARAAGFVPVRISVLSAPERFADAFDRGWPYIATTDAAGATIRELPGLRPADAIEADLAGAAGDAAARGIAPAAPWDRVWADEAACDGAVTARDAGRLGEAWTRFAAVAPAADAVPTPGAGAAQRGLANLRGVAADALSRVTEAASHDARAAAEAAEDAARRFAGSPPGDEFAAIARALRERGVLPRLTAAR